MKAALVVYGSLDSVTGGYLYDRLLINKLRERGDHVEVFSLAPGSYGRHLLDNITYHNPGGFDLILQDELNHPSLLWANRRQRSTPIVSIVHHLRSSERRSPYANAIYRHLEKKYLKSLDGLILNSDATKASVERLLTAHKAWIIATPGGDRLGQSSREDVVERAHRPGALRLIYVGGVAPNKGLQVLLDALAILPSVDLHLDVAGSQSVAPQFYSKMQQEAAERRLPVSFLGLLDDADLAQRLQSSHVLALPSYYEGFGIAYLEGMAHGLPALATRAGGAPELVTDGLNGFLIEAGDSAALSGHIAELAGDRDLLARMGLAAIHRYRSFPTWAQTTERTRDFLVGLVGHGAAAVSNSRRQGSGQQGAGG